MKWKTNTGVRLWVRDSPNHHAGQDCNGSGCHTSRDKFALRPAAPRPAAPGTGTTNSVPAARGAAASPRVPSTSALPGELPAATGPFTHPPKGAAPCVSCHNGAGARPATHIGTTDRCGHCHSTIAWLPVIGVDHTQVSGSLQRLPQRRHGDRQAGQAPGHGSRLRKLPHDQRLDSGTRGSQGDRRAHLRHLPQRRARHRHAAHARSNHAVLRHLSRHTRLASGARRSRAPGDNLRHAVTTTSRLSGVPPGHLNLRSDCSSCHAYPDWNVVHFRHSGMAYPGKHRADIGCSTCHTSNTEAVPYPSPANAGTCAGCHARNFTPASHPKDTKGVSYTVSELANCSGACHVYSDPTQATIAKRLPGPHHRVSDATFKH